MRRLAMIALVLVVACEDEQPPGQLIIIDVIVPPTALGASSDPPTADPPEALLEATERGPGRWVLAVHWALGTKVLAEGACPIEVHPPPPVKGEPRADRQEPFRLVPLVEIEGATDELGFGGSFELSAMSRCDAMAGARYAWRVDGAEVADFETDGATVRGTMPGLAASLGGVPTEQGVVALSPRSRGTRTLLLSVTAPDGAVVERRVPLHAAARSTGMPSVPTDVGVYLVGTDLGFLNVPHDAQPELESLGADLYRFRTATPGRYLLKTGEDEYAFSLLAGSHYATPLDCGRVECHASATDHAASSAMTHVFSRLSQNHGYPSSCAVGCHTVGEPGTGDGGFVDIAGQLDVALPEHGGAGLYESLPRELRRLSGVGCTACHGPGAIPEPGAKPRIMRTAVCATCHDAPPRYGHVAAFSANRMSRASHADGIDSDPRCLSCHTTDGFLHGITDAEGAPREVAMDGLGCATCHAPHDADPGPALLRTWPLPPILEGALTTLSEHPSRVCVTCHAPAPGFDLPTASATALVVGRGGFSADGSSLEVDGVHAALEGGCLACHGSAGSPGIDRGGRHAFAVSPTVCESCHEGQSFGEARAALRARARDLFDRVGAADSRGEARAGVVDRRAERARFNVALVRFDRGALSHGGGYSTRLLDEAELMLGGPSSQRAQ